MTAPKVSLLVPFRPGIPPRDRAWNFLRKRYAARFPTWEIVTDPGPDGEFSRAGAIAAAAARASGGIFVVADADVWCEGVSGAVARVAAGAPWADPAHPKAVVRMTAVATDALLRTGRFSEEGVVRRASRTACEGLVVLTREALVRCPPEEETRWSEALTAVYGPAALGPPKALPILWRLWTPAAAAAKKTPAAPTPAPRGSAKLHIGCGPRRLPGWINADAVPGVGEAVLDLHDPAALPPGAFTVIYGCHVLEHCWPQDTPAILRRLLAALVPGGTLRLSVPDLRLVVANCLDTSRYGSERAALAVLYGGDFSRTTTDPDRHRQIFWRERLEALLGEAGFVRVRPWGKGSYPEIDALGDYATHPADESGRSLISLNLEADRPGDLTRPGRAPVEVSVLLGTVHRPQMVRACIAAVRESLQGLPAEIVVAYGAEDEPALPWLAEQPDVRLVLGGMEGAIEAFNRAYAASRGRYVCQINDDVLVEGDAIARAVRHLEEDPTCAGVVFQFDRGDGRGYRHEWLGGGSGAKGALSSPDAAPSLHPNQMVVRRETCEAVVERIGGLWGDQAHRTDKTYGGDSAFGALCRHLGLRLDSVPGVTCKDRCGEAQDALRRKNADVDPGHGERWRAAYFPLIAGPAVAPRADEWPNLYIPRPGMPPRRSPVPAGRPLRLLHLSLQTTQEPQEDLRRAFSCVGPTAEVPWDLIRTTHGSMEAAGRAIVSAAREHRPDVVWAQIHGAWKADLQRALRDAVGPQCTLIQWTGDVRTSGAQPVDRWLVELGAHFDILLADGCTYARKLKGEERVAAACGYLSCGMDPGLNPWRPEAEEDPAPRAIFTGSHYPTVHFGDNDRTRVFEETNRLAPRLLTLYGVGWDKTRLAGIAKGFVPQKDASLLYRRTPLTIATSIYQDIERYTSDRLKRAMASGAVLAVRRFPDLEGLGLVDGVNCLLWSTPADLASLLKDWTRPERAPERARIRAAAAELAHRRYSWDVVTEELLAIVRDHRARRGLG